jgi:hypothetical protein
LNSLHIITCFSKPDKPDEQKKRRKKGIQRERGKKKKEMGARERRSEMIEVDEGICDKLGRKLKDVQVLSHKFLAEDSRTAWTEEERRKEANFRFYLVAFCQHTKSLQGIIEGEWYRGWDYLERACRRAMADDPDYFSAENMSRITGQELRRILSDDFDPAHSTLDRVEERVTQLRDCGQRLAAQYDGDVMNLYRQAGGYLHGERGILELMSEFKAYSDPIQKKSFLFLMFVSPGGHLEDQRPGEPEGGRRLPHHAHRLAERDGQGRRPARDGAKRAQRGGHRHGH